MQKDLITASNEVHQFICKWSKVPNIYINFYDMISIKTKLIS